MYTIEVSASSIVNIRVCLKQHICELWRFRNKWKKTFGHKNLGIHNYNVRDAIRAYRDMKNAKFVI